jgi:hypothetical protein
MPNTNRRATNVEQYSLNKSANRLHETSRLRGRWRTARYLPGLLLALTACGGGGGSGGGNQPTNDATSDTPTTSSAPEVGAFTKIIPVTGDPGAVVALFPDGRAFFSPDGFNLGGGGSTILAYSGSLQVADVVVSGNGVESLLSDGSAYFSPDGKNLGGGGATVVAYQGSSQVMSLTSVGSGIDAVLQGSPGSEVYYSSDGLNLGGGGTTVKIYAGASVAQQIVAIGPGDAVVTLFNNGTAFYSSDNRSLGGGGSTVSAAGPALVKKLVQVGGGVLAEFQNGDVYLSSNGQNLAGGGGTIGVASWDNSSGDGPFPPRDSAHGAIFLDVLWLSGGFSDPSGANSCFDTCSYYDLWSSTDSTGATWNTTPSFATATTPDPRDATPVVNNGVQDSPLPTDFYDSYSALIVWNNQLTAIGATVWQSSNGTTWARQNLSDGSPNPGPIPAPYHATENSRALELGGVLYFLQLDWGEAYSTTATTATSWTDLGTTGFSPRCGSTAFVLGGLIWVEGGGACDYSAVYNDIWSSPDAVHWTKQPTPAAWSGRMWPCVATIDGVVWLAAGYAPTDWNLIDGQQSVRYGSNHADLWYSKNGIDWSQFKADLGSGLPDDGKMEPRHAPTCYLAGATAATRSIVIMAGTGGSDPNDADAGTINSIRRLALPEASTLP